MDKLSDISTQKGTWMAQTNLNPIAATDLRLRLRDVLEQVKWHDAQYLITTFGQPMAVILPMAVYERLTGSQGEGVRTPRLDPAIEIESA